jgi:transcriptional regulator with XRE-family HTH domain
MKNVKQQFAERLKKAMVKAGYKPQPAVLERNFNLNYYGKPITLHGVRKWLIGESIPPYDKIIALAGMLNIPPDELTFGLEIKTTIKEKRARWEEGIGYQEREVFEAFLALPAPQRKIVREVIQTFAKAFPAEAVVKHHAAKKT